MAARFRLRFDWIGPPIEFSSPHTAAYWLRGGLIPVLREAGGVDSLHGQRYGLEPAPDLRDAALSVGDDSRATSLTYGLATVRDDLVEIPIAGSFARLVSFDVETGAPSQELLDATPAQALWVDFATVTTFAAGDRRSRGIPDPALIIGSWSASWNGRHTGNSPARDTGVECPETLGLHLGRLLDPVSGTLTWGAIEFADSENGMKAPAKIYGFTGTLGLRLHRTADAVHRRWLGRLAALVPFVGTGYHTQLGLGATAVKPSWSSSAARPEP